MNNEILLSVYGTLKKGFHNHYLLEKSEYLGSFHTQELEIISGKFYPYSRRSEDAFSLVEVYRIDLDTLQHTDILEGVASGLYTRELIDTPYGKSWTYIYGDPTIKGEVVSEWIG